jgi:ubiquinone biosynthesis accessory factor UbiK
MRCGLRVPASLRARRARKGLCSECANAVFPADQGQKRGFRPGFAPRRDAPGVRAHHIGAFFGVRYGAGRGLECGRFHPLPDAGSPMINDNLIRSLGEQLGRFVSDARSREDMQQSLNTIVQNVFARLDLVTREQFDAQLETLERTRAQLEHLEAELARLQQQLSAQDGNP